MERETTPQAPNLTPGQWLKAARRDAGLTQDEVARVLKVVAATISAYENGRIRRVDEQYVPDLARILRKGVVETRRGLGLFVPDDAAPDQAPVGVLDAILADPQLIPEAREHLMAQYKLLLRIQGDRPESADHARARDELRRARAVDETSQERDTRNGV